MNSDPIQDLIRANFVETNLRLDETHKTLIKILEIVMSINKNFEKEEEVEDNSPIIYPDDNSRNISK